MARRGQVVPKKKAGRVAGRLQAVTRSAAGFSVKRFHVDRRRRPVIWSR
jgi:hypothetical protein